MGLLQYSKVFFSGAEDVEVKRLQALKLVERLWGKIALLSDSEISRLISKPGALIFDAAKQGNVEFLLILTRKYPNLVWNKVEEDDYSIFHIAVLNRQGHIFKLVYQIGSAKDLIVVYKDQKKKKRVTIFCI